MAEPTRARWRLDVWPNGDFEIHTGRDVRDPDYRVICSRQPWTSNTAESHANAYLLNASKDLLAACRAAFAFLVERGDPFAGDDCLLGHQISAAIGKAEGHPECQ